MTQTFKEGVDWNYVIPEEEGTNYVPDSFETLSIYDQDTGAETPVEDI